MTTSIEAAEQISTVDMTLDAAIAALQKDGARNSDSYLHNNAVADIHYTENDPSTRRKLRVILAALGALSEGEVERLAERLASTSLAQQIARKYQSGRRSQPCSACGDEVRIMPTVCGPCSNALEATRNLGDTTTSYDHGSEGRVLRTLFVRSDRLSNVPLCDHTGQQEATVRMPWDYYDGWFNLGEDEG